ncbi:MAG: ATP-binding protein [Alcanivorax sp.]|nr:ATP-binding protein [Alcanivorax sp.]
MGLQRLGVVLAILVAICLLPVETRASSAACQAAGETLTQLNSQLQQRQAERRALGALLNGEMPDRDTLTRLLGQPLQQPLPPLSRPPQPRALADSKCPGLQDDIAVVTGQLNNLDQQVYRQRHQLLDLPPAQRQAYAALLALRSALQTLDPQHTSAAITALNQHLNAVLATLALLARDEDRQALQTLDRLWYQPPALPTADTLPAADYLSLIRSRLEIQKQVRILRADLWQRRPLGQLVNELGGLAQTPTVVTHELQRMTRQIREVGQLIAHDLQRPGEPPHALPLVKNLLTLLLGITGFVLLVRVAHRSRQFALSLHDKVIHVSGERRWLWHASRLISGLAPLLPWLLIWLVLDALTEPLDNSTTRILYWALPLARLYVIYGMACLVGEWLLLRVAQSANRYLNNEQTRQAGDHARHLARWLLPPWLLLMLVQTSLGPSLLYYLLSYLLLAVAYLLLGRLLVLRADDYRLCLQALLPSKLDRLTSVLLHPALFWLFAPLLLPLALLGFALGFVDRMLADFDWYLRLKARWFRLRTRVSSDEPAQEPPESPEDSRYERWFDAGLPEGSDTPIIDTGLVSAMEKHIQRWHEDKTDENALVVTGEKGCGKSLSLGKLEKALHDSCQDLNILRLPVPARTCTPQAINQLIGEALQLDLNEDGPAALVNSDAERRPTLVVLDEAQNLFLASAGGLDGWRNVLSLVNARLDHVYWLLMINNQSWAYLCNVFGREYQFRNVIRVKRWGQAELRSLILSRHHQSGYRLRYDEALLSSRGPDAGNVRNAEQRYFSLLWDASRGNPMVALQLWQTSVRLQGRQVLVGLPTPPSASLLDGMGENALFVYAAIVTHENLASQEISAVTHLPDTVVRYALKAGFDAGFLHKSEDGRYRLVPLWYPPMISYLTGKNLLNE